MENEDSKKDWKRICAPMVRYSKLPFRLLVKEYDCDMTFTPMIVAKSFVDSPNSRFREFSTNNEDTGVIVQFASSDPIELGMAAQFVYSHSSGVDLNCGCPQRWAMQEGMGSHLISEPQKIFDMVRSVRSVISDPQFTVSIKIRIHDDIRKTVCLCKQAEKAGVSFVSVHGRTPKQRCEPVNLQAIREIKSSLQIPVFANGDAKSLKIAQQIVDATNVDGVMSARGILHNPALFSGYETPPIDCVRKWVDLSLSCGGVFTIFHHHLMFMLESLTNKSHKRIFNRLTCVPAVLDYLNEYIFV